MNGNKTQRQGTTRVKIEYKLESILHQQSSLQFAAKFNEDNAETNK